MKYYTIAILVIIMMMVVMIRAEEDIVSTNRRGGYPGGFKAESDAASETEGTLSASSIWAGYAAEIKRFFGVSGKKGFQMLKVPIEASYDMKDNSQTLEGLLDTPTKWGPLRELKEGSIAADYGEFLGILKSKKLTDEDQKRLDLFEADMNDKKERLDYALSTCKRRFNQRNRGLSYPEYERRYCRMTATAKMDYEIAMVTYENEIEALGGSVTKALNAYKEYKGSVYQYKEFQFSSLKAVRAKIDQGERNPFSIVVQSSSVDKTENRGDWSFDNVIKKDESFVSEENGSATKFSFTTSSNDFQMVISADNQAMIQVTPDSWYTQGFLDDHKKGPFIDAELAKPFFGKNGKLTLIPKTLFMLYKPVVNLRVSSKDASYFEKKAGAIIKIGPFEGRVSLKPSKKNDEVSEDHKVVTVTNESDHPLIVAVDNHVV